MKKVIKIVSLFLVISFLNACATYKAQYKDDVRQVMLPFDKEVSHTFYLIGDAGNSSIGEKSAALKAFEVEISKAASNSTVLFLGDNIYPNGLPKKNEADRAFAEHQLNVQTDAVKNFKGRTIFLPGNHDWYNGLKGLKRQEKFIEDKLGKNTFLPENGCPIEKVKISDDIVLLVVDSNWYITNWDKHPTINDDCEIKTRVDFIDELESEIKKARSKTTLIAIHHPMFTNGSHGGQYSFGSHMTPVPVLGTIKNIIRKTGGVANVDLQNKLYNDLKRKIVALSGHNDKVVFVSGHDHNLQYIIQNNSPQIVSGSGSKLNAVRNVDGGQFAHATQGYAKLHVFKDGSSHIQFISAGNNTILFETTVYSEEEDFALNFPETFPKEKIASIYTKEETKKSGFHKFIWGERFREDYSTPVSAPTVNLDTLFGGLKVVRKGGGNQSKSLRLEDKNGAQYVMRALRKQATQYLQAMLFQNDYIGDKLDNSFIEDLVLDVFAGSHPYTPFVIGDLADAVNIYHTTPVLYYVPKQNALGKYNTDFGDELYMIEEHTSEGHNDKASFGYSNTLLSTDDMMKKVHKDEDIIIDEKAYIKARLFDMLIGDWDRHQDQWRWIEFKESGKTIFRPMPRDRDQAFSKMSDGFLLTAAVKLVPTARLLREYSDDLVDVEGINVEPYPLDMELIQRSTKNVWDAQAKYIIENITDAIIENAFLNIPKEVRNQNVEKIKMLLKARRSNLQEISNRYYNLVNKFAVVKGTNKDDWFDIERMPKGKTKVTGYRIKGGKKADVFLERIYSREETKEIWVYALDDDDVFHVSGEGNSLIMLRLIGGQNNDTYDIKNRKKIKLYDYKSKKNTIVTNKGRKKLTDDYQTNVYNYKKLKNNTNQIIPTIGFNPDDGVKIGVMDTYTNYNFERNPFTSKHSFAAAYYFATNGYELGYYGEFANVIGSSNLGVDVKFNSPNFAVNFFGYGNSTRNFEAEDDDGLDVDLNYNRIKIKTFHISPFLIWKGIYGSSFKIALNYETNEVDRTSGRYIETITTQTDPIFEYQNFYGANAQYKYHVRDNDAFPTLGFLFSIDAGYKNNTKTSKGFGYIIPKMAFDYKLIPSGQIVFATNIRGHLNLGDDFEFYQAATIGANFGLRGYRNERFSGKQAFVQSSDIRFNFKKPGSGFVPLSIGVFGGFDYGRIWADENLVTPTNPFSLQDLNSNSWNTSIGGGVFVNAFNLITGNLSVFSSDDDLLIAFKFGFGF